MTEMKSLAEKKEYLYSHPEKMKFAIEELCEHHHEIAVSIIDLAVIGKHLTEETLEKAINGMDFYGSTSVWTLTQTNEVAKSLGIVFDKFNQYDFNFIMNWSMSDMAEVFGLDAMKYGKYAHFLLAKDPDNEHPEERAYVEAQRFIKRYEED